MRYAEVGQRALVDHDIHTEVGDGPDVLQASKQLGERPPADRLVGCTDTIHAHAHEVNTASKALSEDVIDMVAMGRERH